ncbi:Peptidase M50 [Frankia sp. AiPs1]|uniref:peptidase M50 n=1 Tax=Frankia sp. AiPa1 TaxID=573492 RepID=UPI00202B5461|nr:peptidase M50 [Frankia sp. AiPa1]MCL9761359.1 peptidase M50 [Frankia sp. AiPa1]
MSTHDVTRRGGVPPITVRPGFAISATLVTVLLGALTLPATVPDRPAFAYLCGGLIGAVLLGAVLLAADLMRARAAARAGLTVVGITLSAAGSRLVIAPGGRRPAGRGTPGAVVDAPADGSAVDGRSASAIGGRTAGDGQERPVRGGGLRDMAPPTSADWPGDGRVPTGPTGPAGMLGGTDAQADAIRVEARLARAGLAVMAPAGAMLVMLGVFLPGGTTALAGQVALWVGTFALLLTFVEVLPSPRSAGGRLVADRVLRRTGSRVNAERAATRAGVISGWALIALGAAGVFVVGFVALWAVLLGWMALGASRLAQSQQRTSAALAGLRARDVMAPAAPTLSAWTTVDDALREVVLPSRQGVFGVADFEGGLAGVALLRDLAVVPMDDRGITRVNRVLVPLSAVATAAPDDELAELPARLVERPAAGCVVVIEPTADGSPRLVGTVGPAELGRAIETAPLRGQGIGPMRPGNLWR